MYGWVLEKVCEYVGDVLFCGVKVFIGGKFIFYFGVNFFEFMVFIEVIIEMKIVYDEIFGFVVVLFWFRSEKEVVEIVNDMEMGFVGYFYSSDI